MRFPYFRYEPVPASAVDEHFIEPPRVSVQTVERHGLLDDSGWAPARVTAPAAGS